MGQDDRPGSRPEWRDLWKEALLPCGLPLLAALVLVAGVVVVALPRIREHRERADQSRCLHQLMLISQALEAYTLDYADHFPRAPRVTAGAWPDPAADWRVLLTPYLHTPQTLVCPATGDPLSYEFNTRLCGLTMSQVREPTQTLALYDRGFWDHSAPPPHHGGYMIYNLQGWVHWESQTKGYTVDPGAPSLIPPPPPGGRP